MVIVLWIVIVILGLVALFYRSKAKENYHLFELSKEYEWPANVKSITGVWTASSPKLNKDGSIAKKRGRKSNVKTT